MISYPSSNEIYLVSLRKYALNVIRMRSYDLCNIYAPKTSRIFSFPFKISFDSVLYFCVSESVSLLLYTYVNELPTRDIRIKHNETYVCGYVKCNPVPLRVQTKTLRTEKEYKRAYLYTNKFQQ